MEAPELHALFRQALSEADNAERPLAPIHKLLVELRAQGVDRETLLNALESFREQAKDEAEDDLICEAMDYFHGWCAPNLRID